MSLNFRTFLIVALVLTAASFPTTSWKSLSFTLTNEQIYSSVLNVDNGTVYTYVLILADDGLSLRLDYYVLNTSPPTLVVSNRYNFTNPISKPNIIPLNTKALLSYDVASTSTSYLVQIAKQTLAVETNTTTAKR